MVAPGWIIPATGAFVRGRRRGGVRARCEDVRVRRDGGSRRSPRRGCCVGRARFSDGQRPDRNARRHLHNGQQGINAIENRCGNRDTEHRDERLRCNHSRQVCRAARGSDDHEQPALLRRRCVFEHPVGRAVRRHDASLVRDSKLLEQRARWREMLVVALAAHDHADEWQWPRHRPRSRAPY